MKTNVLKRMLCSAGLGMMLLAANGQAEVIRHPIPNSTFPIARAVEIKPDTTVINLSGVVPAVINPAAAKGTLAAYGNTEQQTESVLTIIAATLKDLGLGMGDVIKMQVYLVGDPGKEGKMDFAGFMNAYRKFFGTPQQPLLPSRSVFQVAGLAGAGYLVEIEVVAVRPSKGK